MGYNLGHMKRDGLLGILPLHSTVILPPNDTDFYAATQLGSTLVPGFVYTLLKKRSGAAASVHLNVTVATNWDGADSIVVELDGFNEFYERVNERVTMTAPATTSRSNNIFSKLISAKVISTSTLDNATSIAVGSGTGTATPKIRIPHLVPGREATSVVFTTTAAASVEIVPVLAEGTTLDGFPGRYLVLDYAATNNAIVVGAHFDIERDVGIN